MTFEELKEEANRQGYNLVKKRVTEKLLPCTCGCKRRGRFYHYNPKGISVVCKRCGRSAKGRNETDAIHAWNVAIQSNMNK